MRRGVAASAAEDQGGQLTDGVAHEVSNMLQATSANLGVTRRVEQRHLRLRPSFADGAGQPGPFHSLPIPDACFGAAADSLADVSPIRPYGCASSQGRAQAIAGMPARPA